MDDLLNRLIADYPELTFRHGRRFSFRPPRTITVGPREPHDDLLLLHEVGHALSSHRDYHSGVMRLKMEREAWDKARELCIKYNIVFDEEVAEVQLDTYRAWLDRISRCPKCGLTRFQEPNGEFKCPMCDR